MEYRTAKEKDKAKVDTFCLKHNIAPPTDNMITFIAVNMDGVIEGVCGLKQVYQIEPLISENPVVANNLYQRVAGTVQSHEIKKVRALADPLNTKYVRTMAKEGFKIVETNKLILQKEY